MFQQKLNHRLGPEDNSFLIYDTDATPMNIGAISEFEGEVRYEQFVDYIAAKIHLVPRYRQLVVPTPLGVGRPTWELDPGFDVPRHVHRIPLPKPGTLDQLFELAGRIHEGRLDRTKPLWEIYLVDGMEGGKTGMISKVHHCMADGVGGMSLLMITLDSSPEPSGTAIPDLEETYAIADPVTRVADSVFDAISEGFDAVTDAEERLLDVVSGAGTDWLRMMGASLRTALPYFLFPAKKTPFNRPFSGSRAITGLSARLDEVNNIRKVTGGTINDVALTVLAGALGRYLEGHGESVDGRDVRIFTPVNVRRSAERGTLGNRISMLLVDAPVGERDPLTRLDAIVRQTSRMKQERVSDGVGAFSNALFALPAALSKTLIEMGALPLDQMGNLVCTNVPGPRFPLYSLGHRMLSMYPIVPVAWEMGIGCAITSYDGTIYLGLNADLGAAPDAGLMKDYLAAAYIELRNAAGVTHAPATQPQHESPFPGGAIIV